MPPGLQKLIPAGYKSEDGDFTVLDRKGLDAAVKEYTDSTLQFRLLEAYTHTLGAESVAVPLDSVPKELAAGAKILAGAESSFTGASIIKALEDPGKIDKKLEKAIPGLAELVHLRMGEEELAKGLLSKGVPQKRMDDAELNRWFSASMADLRAKHGTDPIDLAGAERMIKLSKQAILNVGSGVLLLSFLDNAVRDLHDKPGLTDEAIDKLSKFRKLSRPSRKVAERTDVGALVKIDAAKRREAEMELLNETQKKALSVASDRATKKVADARKSLLERIKTWSFGEADLDKLVAYIQTYSPVTIQFHPDKKLPGGKNVVEGFAEEPEYKNQFQTKISSGSLCPTAGSSRDGWEKKCFAGVYHEHDLNPDERPKYGGLSALNSPSGNGGNWYGKCFFELRQDVKFRTTVTPRNSCGCTAEDVTTIDAVEVMLDQVGKKDQSYLKSMFEVARGERHSVKQSYSGSYVEAQIHGTVDLARDVDFVVIDTKYVATPHGQQLLQLAEKWGATVKFTDQNKFFMEVEKS